MKKILVVGLTLMMTLAACGGSVESTVPATAGTDGAAVAGELAAAQGALSPVAENIVGLLKLEDTELAVDPAQAETLLPVVAGVPQSAEQRHDRPGGARGASGADQPGAHRRAAGRHRRHGPEPPGHVRTMAQELGVTTFVGPGDRGDASGTRPSFGGSGPGGAAGGVAPPGGGGGPRQVRSSSEARTADPQATPRANSTRRPLPRFRRAGPPAGRGTASAWPCSTR